MNILITGGAGYIGNVLIELLLKQNDVNITIIDNFLYNQQCLYQYSHIKNIKIIKDNVTNRSCLLKYINLNDVIIPLAALVGFGVCDNNLLLALLINYKQIVNIVNLCKNNQLIIFPNTNSGYGAGLFELGLLCYCTELTPLTPISIYGRTKAMAEQYIINNYTNYIIFRLATVFGASNRMRLDLLVNDFTYRAISDRFIVLFLPYFKRNYIHIRDVASAIIMAITTDAIATNEIYNLGINDINLSKLLLCLKIRLHIPNFYFTVSLFNKDIDQRNYIVSSNKLYSTGWSPKYSIDDGILLLVKLYKFFSSKKTEVSNV